MADYQRLLAKRGHFLEVLEREIRVAHEILPIKHESAIKIQRAFRGSSARAKITKKNFAANEIQRIQRGKYLCIQMQRCFRGYYSRKYKHDQHRRKMYCRMLIEKSEEIAEKMHQYSQEQAERLEEEAREQRKGQFEALARNLHHLTSTRHIRGVYNPVVQLMAQPTMNRLPVEEHIRGVVKDLLRTRGYTKRGLVPDINGTLKIPLKIVKQRLSIQASSHYDALRDAEREQKMSHKYASVASRNFLGGGKTSIIDNKEVPLAVGEPFLDQWANPLLVKGVPRDQQELLESARQQKPLFAAPPQKPFYSRTGGNRSTTVANDVFDVIAEAEETGGAIQRHLGTGTSRFGVPSACDTRSAALGSSINVAATKWDATAAPPPPLRTSVTIRSTTARTKSSQFRVKEKSKTAAHPGSGFVAGAVLTRIASGMAAEAINADLSSSDEEGLSPMSLSRAAARTIA